MIRPRTTNPSNGMRRAGLAGLAAAAVVAAGVALPASPASALGAGTYAYVTSSIPGQESVIVLDATTGATVANVPVDSYPSAVAVSADGLRAYVAEDSGVQVIDARQESVVDTISLSPAGSEALDVTLSPDGSRLYVADFSQNEIVVIDTATDAITARVPVGRNPDGVVATATKVYVANYGAGTVSVIDAASATVTGTIDVGGGPTGLALVPAANRLYVADNDGGHVTAVDTTSDSVTMSVPASGAYQLAVSPDGSRVYASIDNGVLVLDSASSAVLTTIATGTNKFADVTVGPDGRIYDGFDGDGNVSTVAVYDPVTFTQVSSTTFPAILNSVTIGSIAPAPAGKADVQVKVTGPASGAKNTAYTYTETVTNAGPGTATRVAATLVLPKGATLVSASGSYTRVGPLVVWKSVPSLAVNASSTYTVKVKFASKGTNLLAGAAASLSTPDPKLANNLTLVPVSIR